jgi:hypothetical protein
MQSLIRRLSINEYADRDVEGEAWSICIENPTIKLYLMLWVTGAGYFLPCHKRSCRIWRLGGLEPLHTSGSVPRLAVSQIKSHNDKETIHRIQLEAVNSRQKAMSRNDGSSRHMARRIRSKCISWGENKLQSVFPKN